MTPFEFVFALISIISSLALTKIITGVVAIVRHRERGGFSLTHAFWVWIAFAVVVGNWGALWGARADPDWPAIRILAWIGSMTSLYAFCALVVPEVNGDTPLNLKEFHEHEARRYIFAHNFFALVALALVLALDGIVAESIINVGSALVAFCLGTAAYFARGRPQLAITAVLAVLATMFMLANINILAGGPGR